MEKENNELIRVLNVVPNMRAAGIETFVMNVYRNIDRNKVQFDFLVHSQKREFYDDEIERLGGKIYRLTYKDDKNFFKYLRDLDNFFKEHKEYKIVHGHMQSMMPIYLFFSKKNNIPIRIAHSHNNSYEKSLKGFILHMLSRFSGSFSTQNYACSNQAGKYLFKNKKFKIINNGVDIKKFLFNFNDRNEIRKKLNIFDNEILIGNVGRLEKQKNQKYLLHIFSKVYKEKKNIKLLIIGTGSLKNKLVKLSKKLLIYDRVIFIDKSNIVNKYMSAMDIFIFPSLYEGLGIVLIEAQLNGLKCITNQRTIASETQITSNIKYLKLKLKKQWKNEIINCDFNLSNRKIKINDKIRAFDITNVSKEMENEYKFLLKNVEES